jgi:hypothetical protein
MVINSRGVMHASLLSLHVILVLSAKFEFHVSLLLETISGVDGGRVLSSGISELTLTVHNLRPNFLFTLLSG